MESDEYTIDIGARGQVSAVELRPRDAIAGYVLAHGAGAGMRHRFMEAIAQRLAERRIATARYQYPYMEAGRRRPDSPKVLEQVSRACVAAARTRLGDLPLIAGGKSMGGRITSQCQAAEPMEGVRGLAFLGFPLHAAGKPATRRGDHLADVGCPMLFVQGTRDALAQLDLLRPICHRLGERARLHVVEGADHGFAVLKRSGRDPEQVLDEVADAVADFAANRARSS